MDEQEILKRNVEIIDSFNETIKFNDQVCVFVDQDEMQKDFVLTFAYGRGDDHTPHIKLRIAGEVPLYTVIPYTA
jgi:hypothetical protein